MSIGNGQKIANFASHKTERMDTPITEQGGVAINIVNNIATIEFHHPLSNSLPGKVLAQLAHTITEAGQNDEVKVIVLKSSGDRAFCGGASFDELISIKDLATGKQFFSGFANVINAARKCPKFIIGRVQGKAVGGGVGMASAVDICMATKFAAVKLSELAVGIGPFVVGPAVARKVGDSPLARWPLMRPNGIQRLGRRKKDCTKKCTKLQKRWTPPLPPSRKS